MVEKSAQDERLVSISSLAQECLLPKLERSLEDMSSATVKFLQDRILQVDQKLDEILKLLKMSTRNETDLFTLQKRQLLIPLIVLVGEHSDNDKPWTSQQINVKIRTVIEDTLIQCLPNLTTPDLVLSNYFVKDFQSGVIPRKSLFFQCLQFLHSKLKKEDWKLCPAAVTSFEWIITQITYPYLSDFIGDILPSSLLFADDYNDEYKMQGIHCLDHAIKNLNKADLMRDNWTEVIYNAFHGLLNDKNPIIIDKFMPLLYSILKIIEVDPHSNSHIFTKYDETMRKILFAVEFCTERQLKPVWIHHLTLCLEIMGHATLHWIDKICDLLIHLTTTNDIFLWKNILKCLQVCTKNTWLKPNSCQTVEIILRIVLNTAILDFPNLTEESRLEIFSLAKDCINLVKYNSDYDSVSSQIQEIKENDKLHPSFRSIVNDF